MSADGGNIFRNSFAKAVERLNDFTINSIAITVEGRTQTYRDVCLKYEHYLLYCHLSQLLRHPYRVETRL